MCCHDLVVSPTAVPLCTGWRNEVAIRITHTQLGRWMCGGQADRQAWTKNLSSAAPVCISAISRESKIPPVPAPAQCLGRSNFRDLVNITPLLPVAVDGRRVCADSEEMIREGPVAASNSRSAGLLIRCKGRNKRQPALSGVIYTYLSCFAIVAPPPHTHTHSAATCPPGSISLACSSACKVASQPAV